MANKEITIYIPSQGKIDEHAAEWDYNFNKSSLLDHLKRIKTSLSAATEVKYKVGGKITNKPPKVIESLFSESLSKLKKPELARIAATFNLDDRNLLAELQLWPPKLRSLVNLTAENGICNEDEMDVVFPTNSSSNNYYYWRTYDRLDDVYAEHSPLLGWMEYAKLNSSGHLAGPTGEVYGVLPYRWHKVIYESLHEDVLQPYPEVGDADISASGLTHVNLQDKIADALTYLVQAFRADVIELGSTRILSKTDLKKISGIDFQMDPFTEGPYRELLGGYFAQSLAVQFMRAAVPSVVPRDSMTMPDGLLVVDRMFRNTSKLNNIQLYEIILPHLSGFKQSALYKFKSEAFAEGIHLQLKDNGRQWLDVQVLERKVYVHAIEKKDPMIMDFGIESAKLLSAMTDREVTVETLNPDVMFPFIEGFLVQLMAIGVLEGVFAPLEKGMKSYFGGLRYVRLTELGQRLYGHTQDFTLSLSDKYACQYDLVDGPLLVYSRVPDNPYDKFLGDIAVKTGKYWNVTTESFLRACVTAEDIRRNITTFKQSICKNPPAAWQQFFETLVRKADNTPQRDNTAWRIFTISPDDIELQNLLRSAPFRNIVVRAEGYRILVKSTDAATFTQLLRSNGYLI